MSVNTGTGRSTSVCQAVRLGSKPAGSLSVNLEAHIMDYLPQQSALLCHAASFQAEISQPSCCEFTECELKHDVKGMTWLHAFLWESVSTMNRLKIGLL